MCGCNCGDEKPRHKHYGDDVEYLPLLLALGEAMAIEFDSVLSDEDLANIRHHIIERERNYIEELDVVLDAYYNLREQIKRDGEN